MILQSPLDPNIQVKIEGMNFDYGCLEMLEIKIVSGRSFSKDLSSDSVKARILNESAAKALGIKYTQDSIWAGPEYIGIFKDFFVHSKHEKISPLMIKICEEKLLQEIVIRCRPESQSVVMGSIEKLWKFFFGDSKPDCILFENAVGEMYSVEDELVKLLGIFTWITVLIAVMGLFAFSLFVIEKRTKEIGIKKVNGATAMDIFKSISWEFLRLVLLAILISWPAGWYIIHKWQQNFAYHEGPGWKIFVFSGVMALVVVQLTILIHILKASRSNPVNVLRYE
jgi:putative ABC transport system permease protein